MKREPIFFSLNRPYPLLFFIVCAVALLSLNIAWLNPRPDYSVVKVPKVPLGWQYNLDSGMNLLSATYFPEYFLYNAQRLSRPVIYGLVHFIGAVGLFLSKPIVALSPLMVHAAAFLAFKFMAYFAIACLYFRLLLFYMPALPAFLASTMLLTQHYSITYLSSFVDTEAQWLSPIIIAYLLHSLSRVYSERKNILFSMLVCVLMLAKQNYAMYLAILVWAFFQGHYRKIAISLISYSVPYLVWRAYVSSKGIPYFNPQITIEGYGMAYFKELWSQGTLFFAQSVIHSWRDYLLSSLLLYHVPLLLMLTKLNEFVHRFGKSLFVLLGLFIFMNWIQFFATRKVINTVMVGDWSLFVWAAGALALTEYLNILVPRIRRTVLLGVAVLWVCFHILSLINFPWVHPKDQKEAQMKDKYLSKEASVPTYQMLPKPD